MLPPLSLERAIEQTVREEWGRILSALVKTLGDFQLAEDCLQDAIVSAMEHWGRNGLPRTPAAWLLTAARRKAIDRLRRDKSFASKQHEISYLMDLDNQTEGQGEPQAIPDKRLEMIFTCCHPALEEKTRVALTLRTLGGLSTQEIASAFLDTPDAMQQRLTRAKRKIASAGIPYEIPDHNVLPDRIPSVLTVIYLIFNEGYSASSGADLTRVDLIDEAIRLARIVSRLLPEECEVAGLLALMLLHDSRRRARIGRDGEFVPLELQIRTRWDKAKILEGSRILENILPRNQVGPYQLQAAISAVHAQSPSWPETDWQQISALYGLLYALQPTSVVRINQAIAISYACSLPTALAMLDEAAASGAMERYQPYFAARADILSRSGEKRAAAACYRKAISLSKNGPERAFLGEKLEQLKASLQ